MQDVKDLSLIIDSKVPLIALETHDEAAALQLLTRVAMQRKVGYFCWSLTEGLNRLSFGDDARRSRSEEHTSELQSRENLVCRLLLEKKKQTSKEQVLKNFR